MLPQVLTLALEEKARKSRAKGRDVAQTLKTGKIHCEHLERILGKDLDFNEPEANLERVGEYYLDQRSQEFTPWGTPIKAHTVLKELTTLGQGLRKAKRYRLYDGEATLVIPDALKDGEVYVPSDRWLTADEYAASHATATPHRRPWLEFLVETGSDLGEMHKIVKTEHVDLSTARGPSGAVFLPGTKSASRPRWMPLTKAARAAVDERMSVAGPMLFAPKWSSCNFKRSTRQWSKRTGVAPFIAKDLRRTFCSRHAQLGTPMLHLERLMGHSDSRMIKLVYARLCPETFEQAITRLDAAPYLRQATVIDLKKRRETMGAQKGETCKNR